MLHCDSSLYTRELNVIVLCLNFHQISNQACTIAKPRPFHYPAKIRNVIIGRNNPATLPPAVNATKAYIHLFKRRICRAPRALRAGRLSCRLAFLSFPSQDKDQLSTCRKPHRLCFGFRPQCSFQS